MTTTDANIYSKFICQDITFIVNSYVFLRKANGHLIYHTVINYFSKEKIKMFPKNNHLVNFLFLMSD